MADASTTQASRGFAERSVFWMILVAAVAVTALIAILIAFTSDSDSSATLATDAAGEEEINQDPTGAGTNPDGMADQPTEGIVESTPEGGEELVSPAEGDTAQAGDEVAPTDSTDQSATELVDDPDNGQPNEPDGGAEEFFPTPSGPEGSDDNALTFE